MSKKETLIRELKEHIESNMLSTEQLKELEKEVKRKEKNLFLAEDYLNSLGISTRTEYNMYRPAYDILCDLGEYLSKNKEKS